MFDLIFPIRGEKKHMKYYAKYFFERSPLSNNSYTLISKTNNVPGLFFKRYADTPKNIELGINNKEYLYYTVPREESIKKYFAHTFEGAANKVITSTEELDEKNRTFGDAKKIGLNDLILFQFSEDMNKLVMYFVKNKGSTRQMKQKCFKQWCDGEKLVSE